MVLNRSLAPDQTYLLIGQPDLLLELLEQLEAQLLDSLTAPGEAVFELVIGQAGALAELEQLEAQSLDSLTAPGAAVFEPLIVIGQAGSLAELEQLEAQSLDSLTAPGDAASLQQPSVEQQESEVDTAPRAALSSVLLLLQAARTLRRATAAKVVRVRVMALSLRLAGISWWERTFAPKRSSQTPTSMVWEYTFS